YTCSNLEKSKKCSWSSKSQELEAVGILWCTDNNIYNNTVDFASREEIPTHKELDDSLVRVATTASSLEAEQDSGNNNKTQSKATPNESSSQRTNSSSGPRCQETMGDTIAQTRELCKVQATSLRGSEGNVMEETLQSQDFPC
nr:hypothetical protein [Tanacetum cinerariifolium]